MHPLAKPKCQRPRGFALITVITLMALLAVLVMGVLSLSAVTIRSSQQGHAMSVAQANARLALFIAIADLQKQVGPDQKITARADLLDSSVANPMWTAVWNSEGGDPVYLVSGNSFGKAQTQSGASSRGNHRPDKKLSREDGSLLFGAGLPEDQQVFAPTVHLNGPEKGSFAFWIADEGVKARIDLKNPYRDATSDKDLHLAAGVAQSNSIRHASADLKRGWPADDSKFGHLLSLEQAGLLNLGIPDFHRKYFHDLTAHSRGLLTDAKNGGLKRDLTLAFENEDVFERWFGRKQASQTTPAASVTGVVITTEGGYQHTVGGPGPSPEKFYISDEFRNYRNKDAGPNWGILCHYYNLHKQVAAQADSFPFILPHPPANMQARRSSWDPYTEYIDTSGSQDRIYTSDLQHNNNYVAPVPGRFQVAYRLRSRLVGIRPDGQRSYSIILEFKPVIGIWNPYNVTFRHHRYRVEWEMSPILKIEIDDRTTFPGGPFNMEVDMTGWYGRSDDSDLLTFFTNEVDLRPGELRIFSLKQEATIPSRSFRGGASASLNYTLDSAWGEEGYFQMALPRQASSPPAVNAKFQRLEVAGSAKIRVISLSLSDQKYNTRGWQDTAGNWFSFKPGTGMVGTSRSTNIWQPEVPSMAPEPIEDIPPMPAESLRSSSQPLGSWVFSLRSTEGESGQNIRNLIDSNVRAANMNSRWDGSHGGMGLSVVSPFRGEGPNGRGLLMPGAPPEPPSDVLRYSMWHGDGRQPYVACFDLPHSRPLSLGQFQHAVLARYNHEPSFVVGNSYADIRVPLAEKVNTSFLGPDGGNGDVGLRTFDISYLVNEQIWDRYFLSGLSADDKLLSADDFRKIARGEISAPNARVKILSAHLEKKAVIDPGNEEMSEKLAGNLAIEGAFNVNSTSVPAWRAVLAGMADLKLPVFDPATKSKTWEKSNGVVFSRFSSNPGGEGDAWKGFQKLDDDQLDALSLEIVNQVRARGPFRSMGDFVNRSLKEAGGTPASDEYKGPDIRLSGALQTALDSGDAGVNSRFAGFADKAGDPQGQHFEKILGGQSKGAGYAGFILQGDILQALAPVLTVRSDTFTIRTTGTARDSHGKITAQAWCEAVVQRVPEPLTPSVDVAENDRRFGRKFVLTGFRWLRRDEV
jgi:type II secretory pathway pseudopilin PulG